MIGPHRRRRLDESGGRGFGFPLGVLRPWAALGMVLLMMLLSLPTAGDELPLELTPQVRQQMRSLQDAWQTWSAAFFQSDRQSADVALEQLKAIGKFLDFPHLGDLSTGAATCAVQAAKSGDFERANWALEAARQLDSERPETEFATARVRQLRGDFLGALTASVAGYRKLLALPLEGTIWLHNLGVWAAYLLILSGSLFVTLQIAVKGGAVFYDLVRLISPPISPALANVLMVVVLIWPVFLPSGLLWLILYWSVLLWGYGSFTERTIFILLWVLLGTAPLALLYQQRAVQLERMPPNRLITNLEDGRLYGELFDDLAMMRQLWSDSLTVREITADIHRRFGQWEEARNIYSALTENPEVASSDKVAAYNNIAVFYLRSQDASTALTYLERADEANVESAEVYYNKSQAYNLLFDFAKSNDAMSQARRISEKRVEEWNDVRLGSEESGVAIDGGLRRSTALREELKDFWKSDEEADVFATLRRHVSLSVVLVAIVLAVTLHFVRLQVGYRSQRLRRQEPSSRPLRILVPGLASVHDGHGVRALLAILLVVGALILPLVRSLGYRVPLAWDAGNLLPSTASLILLLLLLVLRTLWDLAAEQ